MSQWVRLWDDMPTDPKWRVVARRSGRSIAEVIAVFNFMLVNAGANATERNGTLANFDDEDVAAALDIDACHVTSIREAMQGKTLDGDRLTGWERRQPKREDGAADRAKAWREKKKSENPEIERDSERNRTQPNAEERPEQIQSREDISSSTVRDALEIECREICGIEPVIVDGNFQPIAELLTEDGITPDDVRAGMRAAVAERSFRPRSWSQLSGWVRRAAKDRLSLLEKPQTARAPPAGKPDMYAALEESKRILAARQAAREATQ